LLARAVSLDPARESKPRGGWRCGFHGAGKVEMLRIYPVILETLKKLQPVLQQLELRDRDLARQLRRASTSIALNVAEGTYSRGKNREARYHTALGSARETLACLEVIEHCQLVRVPVVQFHGELNRIIGTLVKLVR
jgi:four helix bundle protein